MIHPCPNYSLVTVTFKGELFLFYLHALSLNRNWKGQKKWHIIVEDSQETYDIIIKDILPLMDKDWEITIDFPNVENDFPPGEGRGWWRVQSLKIWAATYFEEDYFIILDCKNLLLKPADLSLFYHEGSWAVQLEDHDCHVWDQCIQTLNISNPPPRPLAYTPWVWAKDRVISALKYIDDIGIGREYAWKQKYFILDCHVIWALEHQNYQWHSANRFSYMPYSVINCGVDSLDSYKETFKSCTSLVFWTQHRKEFQTETNGMFKLLKEQLEEYNIKYDTVLFEKYFQELLIANDNNI
jgi:hypothetical protein